MLESLKDLGLVWDGPKEVRTRNGIRMLHKTTPNGKFWDLWRGSKKVLKDAGISVSKNKGVWEVCYWAPLSQEKQEEIEKSVNDSKATNADIDIPSPAGLSYLPYQKAGVKYALDHKRVIIGDEMGCISGDAVLQINRAGKGWKISLEDLYLKFNNLVERKNCKWDLTIPTYTKSLCDGEIKHHKIKRVLYKGEKETIKISLESGKYIILTPDHEISCRDEAEQLLWVEAGKLSIGDSILTNGTKVCPGCGSEKNIITYKYAKFFGYCKQCMYRYHRNNNISTGKFIDSDGYVRVGSQFGHPRSNQSNQVYEHILVMEKHLGRYVGLDEDVHHINGNRSDNRLKNLEILSRSEHHKKHSKHKNINIDRHGNEIHWQPKEDRIVSIEKYGIQKVYDIIMDNPYRNFVANGVIVHNCGKTIQAVGVFNADEAIKKAVVVCPASLKLNWKRELEKWLIRDFKIGVVKGSDIPEGCDILIINYDIFYKHEEYFRSQKWDAVVLDESHYLKNVKTRRTISVFGENAENPINADYILCLTGTPIVNRPKELWPTIRALDPEGLGSNFFAFAKRYCAAYKKHIGRGREVWDFDGASNLEELQLRMRESILIRRLKKNVLKDLPPKVRQVIELPANGSADDVQMEWMMYQKKQESLLQVQNLMEKAKEVGDEKEYRKHLKTLQTGAKVVFEEMAGLRHRTALAKVPQVIDHLKMLLENGPVVCFAHHKDVIQKIQEAFPNSVTLTGDTPMEKKQKAIDDFQEGKVDLFIGSIKAAGVGITLTRANVVVFAEMDWTPAGLQQPEDRLHRIGQLDSVLVHLLVLENSFDAEIAKTVVEKLELIEMALDEGDILGLVKEEPVVLDVSMLKSVEKKIDSEQLLDVTPEQIEAIQQGLQTLSSYCDGAMSLDGMGFNKFDSSIGKSLASRGLHTPKQIIYGKKLVQKYQGQLPNELIVAAGITPKA